MRGIDIVPESFVLRGTETKNFAYSNIEPGTVKVWRYHPEAFGKNTLYVEGADYTIDYTNGRITRLAGSTIPDASGKPSPTSGSYSDSTTGNINYQVWATGRRYSIRDVRKKSTKLPRFTGKFSTNGTLNITILGDSISNGGETEINDHIFWNVWKRVVESYHSIKVVINNQAVGGTTSSNLTAGNLATMVTGTPDLITIGFGMNDQKVNDANTFQANIQNAINWIKTNFPNADILLLSGCLANYETFYTTTEKVRFDSYLPVLQTLAVQDNVALADVTSEWQRYLGRKDYHDLLRNDINHPTSFGHMEIYCRVLSDFMPLKFK